MRPTLALALVLLLTAPTSAAWGFGSPDVTVPAAHAGDRYEYARRVVESFSGAMPTDASGRVDLALGESRLVVEVGAPTTALDRYGVPRAVDPYHVQLSQGNVVVTDERCDMLLHSAQAIRRDFAASPPDYAYSSTWSDLVQEHRSDLNFTPITTYDPRPCDGHTMWTGTEHSAGDVVHLWSPTLIPGLPQYVSWVPSEPGVLVDFHGRRALSYRFDVATLVPSWYGKGAGNVTLVLADGLPAIARFEIHSVLADARSTRTIDASAELAGYDAGSGPALESDGNTQQPERSPAATFAPVDRLYVDDEAFALPYPLADAIAAVRADPAVKASGFLRAHPDALLITAMYERHMTDPALGSDAAAGAEGTDGGWYLVFSSGSAHQTVITQRATGVGPLGAPVKATRDADASSSGPFPTWRGAVPPMASSSDLARLVAAGGLDPTKLESLAYFAFDNGGGIGGVLFASDVTRMFAHPGTESGRYVSLSPFTGAVNAVEIHARRDSASLLSPPASVDAAPSTSAVARLAGPGLGAGLAGGAALTGLALLVLLLKLVLIPLFTRLRRDGLLDNPVRARLYERVRAEPGIHLADLIDYAGIGEGATRHHMEQLAKHRLVVRLEEEKFVRYYAAGEVPPSLARREAVLRAGSMRAVYDLYCREPGLPLRAAGERLGLSAPSVHRCKKRLEKAGLLPAAPEAQVNAAA